MVDYEANNLTSGTRNSRSGTNIASEKKEYLVTNQK